MDWTRLRPSCRTFAGIGSDVTRPLTGRYAQLLYAETIPNPALEKNADAPPEKLVICFAVAEVTLLGSGLQAVARKIQKCDLNFVKAIDRRFAATLKTHVADVAVNFTNQKL